MGLDFAYNWMNSAMPDDMLIAKVIKLGRFHDLAVICRRFGMERVGQIAAKAANPPKHLGRSLANIETGFGRGPLATDLGPSSAEGPRLTGVANLGDRVRSCDLFALFMLCQERGYSAREILGDAVRYGANNDPEYYKAVLRGEIPLDDDDEGLEPVGIAVTLDTIYRYFDEAVSRAEVAEAARIARGGAL